MKTLTTTLALTLFAATVAAAPAPRSPDFVAAKAPRPAVDPSVVLSSGTSPIMPADVISFGIDSDVISLANLTEITDAVRFLKAHPSQTIVLEGHTDKLGHKSFNEDLATRRAENVRTQLRLRGIPSDRIVIEVFGAVGARQVNELDRAVVMKTSMQPLRMVVDDALEHQHALNVRWSDHGTQFTESMGGHVGKTRIGSL